MVQCETSYTSQSALPLMNSSTWTSAAHGTIPWTTTCSLWNSALRVVMVHIGNKTYQWLKVMPFLFEPLVWMSFSAFKTQFTSEYQTGLVTWHSWFCACLHKWLLDLKLWPHIVSAFHLISPHLQSVVNFFFQWRWNITYGTDQNS